MKKFLQKYLPDPQEILHNPLVSRFKHLLTDPNLWHLNRRSVSWGIFCGIFAAFMPPGLQLILAIPMAVVLRGNLAVAFAATWVTNPFTYLPIYFTCYRLGLWILGGNPDINLSQFNLETLANDLMNIGKPLLVGCSVSAVVFSILSLLIVRLLWRLHIIRHIKERAARRKARKITQQD